MSIILKIKPACGESTEHERVILLACHPNTVEGANTFIFFKNVGLFGELFCLFCLNRN